MHPLIEQFNDSKKMTSIDLERREPTSPGASMSSNVVNRPTDSSRTVARHPSVTSRSPSPENPKRNLFSLHVQSLAVPLRGLDQKLARRRGVPRLHPPLAAPAMPTFPCFLSGSASALNYSGPAQRSLLVAARVLAKSPSDPLHRRLQPSCYRHDCSDCYRLER